MYVNKVVIVLVDFISILIPLVTVILMSIASFAILYSFDKIHKVRIKLVAIGNQWF